MAAAAGELVTVVIPTYNASITVDDTLLSVRLQSYSNLEILVVDDGSTDETVERIEAHAAVDPRVRLIRQAHGGVAEARNRGIAEARGELVAPVDADDVWRPEKIERQLQALDAADPSAALVYTWYMRIDPEGRMLRPGPRVAAQGDVLGLLAVRNFIGNGSSALIRKAALLDAGGYDPTLRDRDAQGCEDWKLYFEIAERHGFAVVPEFLTGYRQSGDTMSSDAMRMLRSREICWAEFGARHPEFAADFRRARKDQMRWTFHHTLLSGRFRDAGELAARLAKLDPLHLAGIALLLPFRAAGYFLSVAARRMTRGVREPPAPYLVLPPPPRAAITPSGEARGRQATKRT